jgi:signal transduction histidine kinase/HAMP domain-containing protein
MTRRPHERAHDTRKRNGPLRHRWSGVMTLLSNRSMRAHLFLLVIIAVSPALAIILYTGMEQRSSAAAEARTRCAILVRSCAGEIEHTVTSTRQMLMTIAVLPDVRALNRAGCTALFRDILRNNPRYLNLQLFRPNGDCLASALPAPSALNVSDRKYFRDALRHRSFAVGEFIVGRTTRQPMLNLAYPIVDKDGGVHAVLQAAVDLSRISQVIDRSLLPDSSTLVVLDHKGTVLFHTADPALIGASDDRELFSDMTRPGNLENVITKQSGESKRIVAFTSLRLPGYDAPYLHVRLELPEEAALSRASFVLARNLWLMIIAACLAGIAAFVHAHIGILNRTSRLVKASEAIAAGMFDTKVGIPYEAGEFGRIAKAFDEMSAHLSRHEKERADFIRELTNAINWALDEKAKNEAIIACVGDGISIQDRSYRILYQNDLHKKLVGDHLNELCYVAYENEQQICPSCPVQLSFQDGLVHTMERQTVIDGNPLYVLVTASPLLDSSGEIVGGIELVKDITAWKQAELELKQTARKLAESNNELQQFAYIASHDLQEPLRTITSFIQLLARRYKGKLDKDADDFIGFITDGAARMQQLINDLLAYSRIESRGQRFVRFDGEAVLSNTLAALGTALAESGAEITHDPLPTLLGDPGQFAQLLQNLISNAIKFRGDAVPRIHVSCVERQEEWELCVRDNGIGIEPQFFERIFEIFQRLHTRQEYVGTGIGLAVCKKIVERHGGRLWVESEPGNGSSFRFTIRKTAGEEA